MERYTKNPITVEAKQIRNIADHPDLKWAWLDTETGMIVDNMPKGGFFRRIMSIHTLEGWHEVVPGAWLIKGIKGELYPCDDEIFMATYAPAEQLQGQAS